MQILVKIVEQMQLRTFPSQTRICVEKDIASEFFILMKGKVRIHQRMGESEFALDREIGVLEPFSCMGEACLIGGGTADQGSADQRHQKVEQTYRTACCTAKISSAKMLAAFNYISSIHVRVYFRSRTIMTISTKKFHFVNQKILFGQF